MKVYELEWTWRDPKTWTELYYLSPPIPVPPNTSIHSPIRPKNRSDSILFLYYSGSVYLSDLSGFKCSLKERFSWIWWRQTLQRSSWFCHLSNFVIEFLGRHQKIPVSLTVFYGFYRYKNVTGMVPRMTRKWRVNKSCELEMLKWSLVILNILEWSWTSRRLLDDLRWKDFLGTSSRVTPIGLNCILF